MADQGDFTSGSVLTAAELNAFRQVTILQDTITVANATNVTPAFSTELIDVGGWHASGASTIVAPYDGVYLVTANARFMNSANRALVEILVGVTEWFSSDNANGANDLSCGGHLTMSASDAVSLLLYQNSGSSKTPVVTFSLELVRRT